MKTLSKHQARADDYSCREYGVTPAELERFKKQMKQKISAERKRGKPKRFTGDLERDLAERS